MLSEATRLSGSVAQPTTHTVEAALNQERLQQEIWTILIIKQPTTTMNSPNIFI